MSVIRSFIFFDIKYEYNITLIQKILSATQNSLKSSVSKCLE